MFDTRRLELLLEISRLLSSKLELSEVLTAVLELSTRVVEAETASLLILDEATQELYFDVALGITGPAAKARLRLGQGIAGTVALNRRSEIINDAGQDQRWSPQMDDMSGFRTRSILATPILLKGKLLGVVEVINKRIGRFEHADQEILEAFASQAAIAIDNARLFSTLREERFKLSTIFMQMNDGTILTDDRGKIILANPAAKRLLGEDIKDIHTALEAFGVTPSLKDLLADNKPSQEFAALRPEPTLLVIAGRATLTSLSSGAGRLFVFIDDTETWRQEHMKRSFLSLISHKLRTPIASVIGFSDILLGELDPIKTDPPKYRAVQTIHEQGVKLSELIDKMIRYATLEGAETKAQTESLSVDEAIAEAVKSLRDRILKRGAKIDYAATSLVVAANKDLFIEAIKNLVENALKFDAKPNPVVAIRAKSAEGWLALSVTDMGPGIPPEAQAAVFSRFHQVEKDFTGQNEGFGLGLPFVKKVAEMHGGKVALHSKLGTGTTVILSLPRNSP